MKNDLISRQAAITALIFSDKTKSLKCGELARVIKVLLDLPSVQPESAKNQIDHEITKDVIDRWKSEMSTSPIMIISEQPEIIRCDVEMLTDLVERITGLPSAQPEGDPIAILKNEIEDLFERVETIEKQIKVDKEEQLKKLKAELDYAKFRCALPTINRTIVSKVSERKKGKWMVIEKGLLVTVYECSECKRHVMDDTGYDVAEDYPFCHCGADMRGEDNA